MSEANLSEADLSEASLDEANLSGANLSGANLRGAELNKANLRNACLCDAQLFMAQLYGAYLFGVNIKGADLSNANLFRATNVPIIPMTCPDTGSFTAWKKAARRYIVKLLVPEDARRSSSTGRKCRCDKAFVVAIETMEGEPSGLDEIESSFDNTFVYKVGQVAIEPTFCEDRFLECAAGIHFFINRQEAVDY